MELKSESFEMDEEREEGELTEEELEDVSDSSISIQSLESIILCDTNIMYREPFKELSLTSVSDESSDNVSIVEVSNVKPVPIRNKFISRGNCRRYCKHKRFERDYSPSKRLKYTKRRYSKTKSNYQKHYSNVSSSSSESDQYISDKKVLRQLRDAVRISSTKKNPNCSLRTRIKRMIEPDSPQSKPTDDDQELENLRDQALKSKSSNSNPSEDIAESNEPASTITDEDLFNLRLIALQSAVLKKHENRIKRKEKQEIEKKKDEIIVESMNSENQNNNVELMTDNNNEEIASSQPVENSTEPTNVSDKTSEEIKSADTKEENAFPSEKKQEEEHVNAEKNDGEVEKIKQKQTVEEDEDILRAMLLTSISKKISNKNNCKRNNIQVTSRTNQLKPIISVPREKNLAIQSSKAPTVPVKRFVINVNTDSESDTNNSVVNRKESGSESYEANNHFEQNLSKFLKEARIKSEVQQQSDISRHLPRSQQIEYRHLKRKLQQLSKMKSHNKVKRLDTDENKRNRLCSMSKRNNSKTKLLNPLSNSATRTSLSVKKQANKVDRLHCKGKYEGLAPLMYKVSQARAARDKAQNEVKRLITELRNARIKLTSTHQNYTVLIQQLLQAKADVDERENQNRTTNIVATPIPTVKTHKENTKENISEISNILQPNNIVSQDIRVQLEEPQITKEDIMPIGDLPPNVPSPELKKDDMEMEVEDNVTKLVDTKIEEEKLLDEIGVMKYNSPLEHIKENSEQYAGNPLLVLCPYDLLGVCRDPDCTYRHCGSAGTE